jgi:hypothetical protein
LIDQLERQAAHNLFSRFTNWYVPRFNAWSHPVRRTDEFAADAAAAQLTSPQAMAEALCATVTREATLDKLYWKPLNDLLADQASPPTDALTRILSVAKTGQLPEVEEQRLLIDAHEANPDPFSTHPTLGERLAALGQAPIVPALPTVTAAEAWLGSNLPRLVATLDAEWATTRIEVWQERHKQLQEKLQRLHELQGRRETGAILTPDEAWELADLTEDHVGATEALPLFRELVEDEKWKAAARFSVGRVLVNSDDASGLPYMAEVMEEDPNYVAAGLAIQEAYYLRQGNREEARRLEAAQLRHADVFDEATAERASVRSTDRIVPHNLPEQEIEVLGNQIMTPEYGIARAWLMRKQVQYFTQKPLYILLVEPRPDKRPRSPEAYQSWTRELAEKLMLPGEGFIMPISKEYSWLESIAKKMPDAEIVMQSSAV